MKTILCKLSVIAVLTSSYALEGPVKEFKDLEFATVGERKLKLDLYMPEGVKNPPLVVSIFGGGWRAGKRKPPGDLAKAMLDSGYALAVIEYRLSKEAIFPAQVEDCKGAIRWLRAHAAEYGYDATRIATYGGSAGGHLALMMGVTGGDPKLEGTVGGNVDQSSKVQAVVDFYGPTDFLLRAKDQPTETEKDSGKVYQLLGGPVAANQEMAKLASPAWHISEGDAPVIMFHGTKDPKVFLNQSERARDALQAAGVPVEFYVVEGGGHGEPDPSKAPPGTVVTPMYNTPKNQERVLKFLEKFLK